MKLTLVCALALALSACAAPSGHVAYNEHGNPIVIGADGTVSRLRPGMAVTVEKEANTTE